MKGKVSTEKTVWCGECDDWYQIDDHKFVKEISQQGWKRTKKYGWLCPKCYEIKKRNKDI